MVNLYIITKYILQDLRKNLFNISFYILDLRRSYINKIHKENVFTKSWKYLTPTI